MKDCKIGMLTTVLIGNSTTFMDQGLMITPRGYANKYSGITGEAIEGEEKGISLSMGLIGWKACARKFMRNDEKQTLRGLAQYFNVNVGEVLSAISEANAEDHAGIFTAAAVAKNNLDEVLSSAKKWGLLRAVVRSEAGAVTELMIKADDFTLKGDWLSIENEHCHLHINWSLVSHAWLTRRGDTLCGVHFNDVKNDSVFHLSLVRREGKFDTEAKTQFEKDWLTLEEKKNNDK